MTEAELNMAVKSISSAALSAGIKDAFFVGGFPRSIAMGLPLSDVHDLDVATASVGKATMLAGLVEEDLRARSELLHRTMSVRLYKGELEMDFQGPMDEPDVVQYLHKRGIHPTPLVRNIYGRDFTINAMAVHAVDPMILIDVTSRGKDDIDNKMISSVMDPEASVPRNPLIITRAVRFSKKYNYKIEERLWKEMKENAKALKGALSPERLAIEAFVLSEYDVAEELTILGLGELLSPEVIMFGQRAASEE